MVNYMKIPQLVTTITHSAVAYTPEVTKFDIHRIENGFDSATIYIADTKSLNYDTRAAAGDAITVQVKDASDAAYTTIFKGIIRVCLPNIDSKEGQFLVLKCDGSGFGLAECLVGQEFGVDSRNPTYDTIGEIVGAGDAGIGILHSWVNHYLGAGGASGYAYTSDLEAMTGTINYISFPYKPANRCIDDLCDLVTAIRQGGAYHPDHIGPHWIVDTDSMLRMKLVNGTQAGWTKYYGDSAANATLQQGIDFLNPEFQDLDPEANCILFYGDWRRPSNGDLWTEGGNALWGHTATHIEVADSATAIVGGQSIQIDSPDGSNGYAWVPAARTAGWDFTSIGTEQNIPTVNWYARVNDNTFGLGMIMMLTGGANFYYYDFTSAFTANDTWYHFSLPIGTFYNFNIEEKTTPKWIKNAAADWGNINSITFYFGGSAGKYLLIDGLHMGGASVCRIAKNSTSITAKKLRTRIITDNVGKDDSLKASDDSGLMAQTAYSELLRLQSQPKVGILTTPMIKDLLPGQWLHVHALTKADGSFAVDKDMRATEVHQVISDQGFLSNIQVTDDLTNTHARKRYDDINKVQAAFRPEWQDRQAASLKASGIDINVVRLEKDYP
jgi:hypothetical protein